MITEVTLKNFKSIKEIQLKLKPLTIFTGTNSSGKSNILESIGIFAEASRLRRKAGNANTVNLENVYSQGDFRKYPNQQVKAFTAYRQRTDFSVTIEVQMNALEVTKKNISDLSSIPLANLATLSKLSSTQSMGYRFEFNSRNQSFAQGIVFDDEIVMAVSKSGYRQTRVLIPKDFMRTQVSGDAEQIFDGKAFVPEDTKKGVFIESDIARVALNSLKRRFEKVFLISGERGLLDAERGVSSGEFPQWVGYRGQNVIEVLSRTFVREPDKFEEMQDWAIKFQLPDIRAGYIGEGKLEAYFKDQELRIALNSALAGSGARQILPIIVQIFSAGTDSVIMVEEPEISLHPEQQVALHELFATAIEEGKQIICTTHSPFLILALSKVVRKKMIPLEDIAVYHVEKDKKGTHVKELQLDKNGFVKSGIPSFMKTEHELYQEWSESLEEE
jgi:predicted ATPase